MAPRLRPLATLFALYASLPGATQAGEGAPVLASVKLLERGEGADLICPQGSAPRKPAPAPSATPRPTPAPPQALEIPAPDETRELLRQLARPEIRQSAGLAESSPPPPLPPGSLFASPPAGQPLRVAIWGDSHLAAGFFTEEIVRQLQLSPAQVESSWIPAQMNRPGVRLPVRKTCVGPGWRHEPAYARADAASAPGPGLVNLLAEEAGAQLAWDLRSSGSPASVQLLYQQTPEPIQISLQLDGGPEQSLTLRGQPGPARLEISADGPIRTLQLRLQEGRLRMHGLALPPRPDARLHLDVFGYPGATVAGWKNADPAYLARWFADQPPYQLVILEFGTNEGNLKPFDPQAYRQTLTQALRRLRTQFPDAACVLMAPGDRGVLLPRRPKTASTNPANPVSPSLTERQQAMLTYTRIHQHIGQIQQDVARDYQCRSWSALDALGGPGSAYRDAHATPPLMARDLIHFTVAGYQAWGRAVVGWGGWKK